MNYYRIPNKFEFPSNLVISTPASSSTLKIATMRHEKSSSLLKLPPIKSTKALPSSKRNDFSQLHEKYRNISDNKDYNESNKDLNDFTGSPLKRILMNNKMSVKENRSVDPHQKNLKEANVISLEFSSDFKLLKSPLIEKTNNFSLEQHRMPKSEQMHLPKMMQGKRLEGVPELKIGAIPNINEDNKRNMNSNKHRDHFQFFFNPSMLLNDQLLDKDDLPKFEPSKCSSKKNGVIKAYAANTHQGLIRNYNEDRVAIILNIIKPQNKKVAEWPACSYFAIYDGHGGSKCAEFLRDNLHHYVNLLLIFKDK